LELKLFLHESKGFAKLDGKTGEKSKNTKPENLENHINGKGKKKNIRA
jgi:hypothetical protein